MPSNDPYIHANKNAQSELGLKMHLDRRPAGLQELGVGAAEGVVGQAWEVLYGCGMGYGGGLELAAADA